MKLSQDLPVLLGFISNSTNQWTEIKTINQHSETRNYVKKKSNDSFDEFHFWIISDSTARWLDLIQLHDKFRYAVPVSEQFRSSFRAVTGQFQPSFSGGERQPHQNGIIDAIYNTINKLWPLSLIQMIAITIIIFARKKKWFPLKKKKKKKEL